MNISISNNSLEVSGFVVENDLKELGINFQKDIISSQEEYKEEPIIEDYKFIIKGENITEKYLPKESIYNLYRYNKNVYAVDDKKGVLFLWSSSKGEERKEEYINKGVEGQVYKKNSNKVIKKMNFHQEDKEDYKKTNIDILNLKFNLKKQGINKNFIIGLYKNSNQISMSLIKNAPNDMSPEQERIYKEEFYYSLFKFNKMGYYHNDLCNRPTHYSPQNHKLTDDGYVTYDMNRPHIIGNDVFLKDQWLWVIYYMQEPSETTRQDFCKFYEDNLGKCLSENPQTLLDILEKNDFKIPERILEEILKENSDTIIDTDVDENINQNYFKNMIEKYSFKTKPSKTTQDIKTIIAEKSIESTHHSQTTQTFLGSVCNKIQGLFRR